MVALRALMAMLIVGATYLAVIETAVFIFEGKKINQKPKRKLFNIKSLV